MNLFTEIAKMLSKFVFKSRFSLVDVCIILYFVIRVVPLYGAIPAVIGIFLCLIFIDYAVYKVGESL